MEYRWGIYDGQLRRVWRWLWGRSGSSNWSAAASLCLIFVGVINIISCPNLNYPITHSVITLLLFPRIHHIYQRLLDLDHFAQIVDFFTQLVVLVLALDQLLSWLLIVLGQQCLHSRLHFLCQELLPLLVLISNLFLSVLVVGCQFKHFLLLHLLYPFYFLNPFSLCGFEQRMRFLLFEHVHSPLLF